VDSTSASLAQQHTLRIGEASFMHPPRVDDAELLDLGEGSIADVRDNLAEMWLINRWLGGLSALTLHLYPRLQAAPSLVTIIDLGTGGAEIPRYLANWSNRHRIPLRLVGIDWASRNLKVAAQTVRDVQNVALLQADALRLPLLDFSVDYFISSLFLHHLPPEAVIALLRSSYQSAGRGIIMTDLVRGLLPLAAFRLIQPIFARNYLTRHDGMLSIRRAYTPDELYQMALAAGIPQPSITTHWPWRMTLVADKPLNDRSM